MPPINYLAVLVAGLVIFMLGGLWYSPVMFAKPWIALQGKTAEEMQAGGGALPMMYLQVFICGLLTAFVLDIVIGIMPRMDLVRALKLVTVCWVGLAAATSYGTALFSGKPKKLWLIDSGFNLVSFLIATAILAKWR